MTPNPTILSQLAFRFLLHAHTYTGGRAGVLITPDIYIRVYDGYTLDVTAAGLNETCSYMARAKHGADIEQSLLATALEMSPWADKWPGDMSHRKKFVEGMMQFFERIMGVTPSRFHVDNVLPPIQC